MRITKENISEFEFSFETLDKLFFEDVEQQEKALKAMGVKVKNESDVFTIDTIKKTKSYEYIVNRVFPLTIEGYGIIENGKLELKTPSVFCEKYIKKIRAKSKFLVSTTIDDTKGLYKVSLYKQNFIIDTETKQINQARHSPFTYKEGAGDEAKGRELLKFMKDIICSGAEEDFKCLCNYVSCCLNYKRSELILFLCSMGAVGKSFFTTLLKKLLGDMQCKIPENILSGDEKFNNLCVGASLGYMEETTGGSTKYDKVMRTMKDWSTSETYLARDMHVSPYEVPNWINLMVLTNYYRDIEIGERRIFYPTISTERMGDTNYFSKLNEQITDDSMQWLYNFFVSIDTGKAPLKAPESRLKQEYITAHLPMPVLFLIEKFLQDPNQPVSKAKATKLYEMFVEWTNKKKIVNVNKRDSFVEMIERYVEKKEKKLDGCVCYDLSYNKLYETIVNKTKCISPERLKEMQGYESEEEEEEAIKEPTEEQKLKEENKKLKDEIEKLRKELQELKDSKTLKEEPKKTEEAKQKPSTKKTPVRTQLKFSPNEFNGLIGLCQI